MPSVCDCTSMAEHVSYCLCSEESEVVIKMFEVGKKYQHIGSRAGIPFKCVYVSDISIPGCLTVLKWPGGAEFVVDRDDWRYYREFSEPRREFFNAFKMGDDTEFTGPYKSRIGSDQFTVSSGYFRYGVLELIHHSDSKVESVFHMVRK